MESAAAGCALMIVVNVCFLFSSFFFLKKVKVNVCQKKMNGVAVHWLLAASNRNQFFFLLPSELGFNDKCGFLSFPGDNKFVQVKHLFPSWLYKLTNSSS